jgi:hypothetical protein
MPTPESLACSGCGVPRPEGTRGCRALFDALTIRQWDLPVAYPVRRMMVDTYALQHPDEFCVSAKSFAAHLTGLCAALEHADHPTVLRVLLAWLESRPALEKPALPTARGAVTIDVAVEAPDGERLVAAADRWARSTWEAYAALQPLARRWVDEAIRHPAATRRR